MGRLIVFPGSPAFSKTPEITAKSVTLIVLLVRNPSHTPTTFGTVANVASLTATALTLLKVGRDPPGLENLTISPTFKSCLKSPTDGEVTLLVV